MNVDYKKAARWLKRELKRLEEFCERDVKDGIVEQNRKFLADYVAGKGHVGNATVGLDYLAGYRGMEGGRRVIAGDEGGFAEIDLACLYSYWSIRILTRVYETNPRPDKQSSVMMERVATCYMHAAALGTQEIRDWLSARLHAVDAGDAAFIGKTMNPLCALVAHFATEHGAAALKRAGWAPLGPYAAVVDRKLTSAGYDELAEYHTKRIGGSDYQEFAFYPYAVLPVELLAIEKLTGVPIGSSKHPLLTSPLVRRRTVAEIPVTEELAAVIQRAQSEQGLGGTGAA